MAITTIMANSIWPNGVKVDDEGFATFYLLGTNKIEVPTSDKWPVGDKIVSPFVYQGEKLVGFCDTEAMTVSENAAVYLPYEHIEVDFSSIQYGTLQIHAPNATVKKAIWADSYSTDIPEAQFKYKGCTTVDAIKAVDANYQTADIVDGVWTEPLWDLENGNMIFYECSNLTSFNGVLPSLKNGDLMFYASQLSEFTSDLSSLTNGEGMFNGCFNLTSFSSDLSSLTNGYGMFYGCSNLTSFTSVLPNLTNGMMMFPYCSKLESFSSDLSNLTNGVDMFVLCDNLTSFSADLSILTNGSNMFTGCSNLASFNIDLSNLRDGTGMFKHCENLISFSSDLSSLRKGNYMFEYCKLDAQSVKNIIDTINTYSAELTLGMGCNNTSRDKDLFAQEAGYTDMTSLLTALQTKKWTVSAQYMGRPTTTYGLRRPSEGALPVFVKLEETEKHADYTSEDGSKKYRLNWFHETTGSTEGYTQFNSLEEAVAHFNIKPIERN